MPSTSYCVGVLRVSLVEKLKRLRGFAVVSAALADPGMGRPGGRPSPIGQK